MNSDVKAGLIIGLVCIGIFLAFFLIKPKETPQEDNPLDSDFGDQASVEFNSQPVQTQPSSNSSQAIFDNSASTVPEIDVIDNSRRNAATSRSSRPLENPSTMADYSNADDIVNNIRPADPILEEIPNQAALSNNGEVAAPPATTSSGTDADGGTPAVTAQNNAVTQTRRTSKTHIVQKGDTLWSLAQRYYGDGNKYKLIRDANPQIPPSNNIKEGEKLIIPNVEQNTGTSSVRPSELVNARTYEVQGGDRLYTIAEKFYSDGNKWNIIYEANKSVIADPNTLKVGEVIIIPELNEE